jgi:Na+-driven multidrug efflux pump
VFVRVIALGSLPTMLTLIYSGVLRSTGDAAHVARSLPLLALCLRRKLFPGRSGDLRCGP